MMLAAINTVAVAPKVHAGQDQRLERDIAPLVLSHQGEVAVAVRNLQTGEALVINGDRPFPTASLIKLPLMIAAYHAVDEGLLDLDKRIVLRASDKVAGSGVLTENFTEDVSLPLRDYIRLMMKFSDNTATNIVIDAVGLRATGELMEQLSLPNTKLHAKVYRRDTSIFPERSQTFGIGSTTANEMVELLTRLHRGQLGDPTSNEAMVAHLLTCDDRSKLARHLSASTKIAHKTGAIANCRTDAGILYTKTGPVAVCVLTNKNRDQSWSTENAANRLCAQIGRHVEQRFGVKQQGNELREGSVGRLVELLQQTLNVRLQPSPKLAVDGDFGPATRAAVERFQRSKQLTADGVVTAATWKALGALVKKEVSAVAPDIVNAQPLPKVPEPSLDGPPIVTCRGWLIGDFRNGDVIDSSAADQTMEPASTTKMMTAYVVLKLAQQDPAVLEETITFSVAADETVGSTSGVRAGEKLTTLELLYGLLLPSGNDASVALAEHFGWRFDSTVHKENRMGSYLAFVVQMNATAVELGMDQTQFKNPHGLHAKGHVVSALDLFRLACVAMRDERFRQIVGTRQYGCTVMRPKSQRYVGWRNTNQLLGIDGYLGIKTGTTRAAGACLVSCGRRNGRELIVVVLGASSSAARYSDTRNLYRWAWRQQQSAEN